MMSIFTIISELQHLTKYNISRLSKFSKLKGCSLKGNAYMLTEVGTLRIYIVPVRNSQMKINFKHTQKITF